MFSINSQPHQITPEDLFNCAQLVDMSEDVSQPAEVRELASKPAPEVVRKPERPRLQRRGGAKGGNAAKRLSTWQVNSSVTDETIRLFLSGLNCPRALTVWLMYLNKEHDALTALEWSATDYATPYDARDAYVATEFLSKASFLETTFKRDEVALRKFHEAESVCATVNARFTSLDVSNGYTGANVWLLHAVTRKITRVLGAFDAEELLESCSWGPGATYSLRGSRTGPVNKFRHEGGMTPSCYTLFNSVFSRAYPLWDRYLTESSKKCDGLEGTCSPCAPFEIVRGNRVICVPKNSKTDRVIAAEPGLNLWFQLGVGRMIGRRLYRHLGIDLESQDRNQLLAFYASRSGSLATVDFSAASDTIAYELVREILPPAWFDVMSSLRSVYGELPDGQTVKYHKFSSMGNGYTFPLQSLIFACAAISCCEYAREQGIEADDDYVGVFGDDVVIPTGAYQLFSEFCSFLGFSFNAKKSFASGDFRESCGSHYLRGVDLKPLYLKERLKNAHSIYRMANGTRRLASRNMYYGCDSRFLTVWRYLVRQVPKEFRFRIPEGLGDGGFVSNFDEAAPFVRRCEGGVEGYYVRHAVQRPTLVAAQDDALLLARLHKSQTSFSDSHREFSGFSLSARERQWELRTLYSEQRSGKARDMAIGNSDSLRRATTVAITSKTVVSRWNELGPWL